MVKRSCFLWRTRCSLNHSQIILNYMIMRFNKLCYYTDLRGGHGHENSVFPKSVKSIFSWKNTETLGKQSALRDHRKPSSCIFVCPYSVCSITFEHTHTSLRNWKVRCGKKRTKKSAKCVLRVPRSLVDIHNCKCCIHLTTLHYGSNGSQPFLVLSVWLFQRNCKVHDLNCKGHLSNTYELK